MLNKITNTTANRLTVPKGYHPVRISGYHSHCFRASNMIKQKITSTLLVFN